MKRWAFLSLLILLLLPLLQSSVSASVSAVQATTPEGLDLPQLLNNITYAAFAGIVAFVVWRRYTVEQDKQREHMEREIQWLRDYLLAGHVTPPLALPPDVAARISGYGASGDGD